MIHRTPVRPGQPRALAFAAVVLSLFVLLVLGVSAAGASVDFFSGFESGGYSPWDGVQASSSVPLSNSFQIVTSPVRSGSYAAKVTVKQGYSPFGYGESTELCCGPTPHESNGSDYWYAWSTYFPTTWVSPYHWGIFAQWHSDFGVPPPVSFDAGDNAAWVNIRAGTVNGASISYTSANQILSTLSKGHWNDFLVHIKWAAGNTGSIEVWNRVPDQSSTFTQVLSLSGIPTLQTQNGTTSNNYFKLGLYRGSYCSQPTTYGCTSSLGTQPDSVLYQDAFARGTSQTDVTTAAWGTSSPAPPPTAGPTSGSTLGTTSAGNLTDPGGADWVDTSGPYALSAGASVSKLTGQIAGEAQAMSVRGVIYADSNGKAGTLVGVTSSVTIKAGAAKAWVDLPFASPVSLAAGSYWLGYWYGPGAGSGGGGFAYTSASGSETYAPLSFNATGSPPSGFPSGGGVSTSRYSLYATLAAAQPTAPPPPSATTMPAISGSVTQGQTLTTSNGSWSGSPTSFSYAWKDCDASGGSCTSAAGATGSSDQLAASDIGHTVRVVVTASNASGSASATSAPTAVVSAPPLPPLTLGTTSAGALVDHGGSGYLDVSGAYSSATSGTVSKLVALISGESQSMSVRGVIYADNGGKPGALVAVGTQVTIAAGAAQSWVTLPFAATLTLGAGTYWLGFWFGPGTGSSGGGFAYANVSGAEAYGAAAYSSTGNPPGTFPVTGTSSSRYSIHS